MLPHQVLAVLYQKLLLNLVSQYGSHQLSKSYILHSFYGLWVILLRKRESWFGNKGLNFFCVKKIIRFYCRKMVTYTVVAQRVWYFVLLIYTNKSWSNIKTRESFGICSSWGFQNCPSESLIWPRFGWDNQGQRQ